MCICCRHGDFDSTATAQFVNSIDGVLLKDGAVLNTFYDQLSLSEGKRFDVEFMVGMCNSLLVVPFVSMDALNRMMNPANVAAVDNVLLEWSLALHLEEQGVVKRILPIFIGPVSQTKPLSFAVLV